jgi:hypothetical protein
LKAPTVGNSRVSRSVLTKHARAKITRIVVVVIVADAQVVVAAVAVAAGKPRDCN